MGTQELKRQFEKYITAGEELPHREELKILFDAQKGSFTNDYFIISIHAIFNYICKNESLKEYKKILCKVKTKLEETGKFKGSAFFTLLNYAPNSPSKKILIQPLDTKSIVDPARDDDFSLKVAYYLFENKAFYEAMKTAEKKYRPKNDREHFKLALVILNNQSGKIITPQKTTPQKRIKHSWVPRAVALVNKDNKRIARGENPKLYYLNTLAKACKVSRSTIIRFFENYPEDELKIAWNYKGLRGQ